MRGQTSGRIYLGTPVMLLTLAMNLLLAIGAQSQPFPSAFSGVDQQRWSDQKFWIDQSAKKALRPTSDPEVWLVLTGQDEKDWSAFEPIRILFSVEVLPPTGAMADALAKAPHRLLGRQMVVLTPAGGTAPARYLTALLLDFGQTYTDGEGTPIQPFAPVHLTGELEEAKGFARDMARLYNGLPPGEPASPP